MPASPRRPCDAITIRSHLCFRAVLMMPSHLELRGKGKSATSLPLVANGNVTMQTTLPTGAYRISAAHVPSAKPARLVVGPYRSSSKNDVLLP